MEGGREASVLTISLISTFFPHNRPGRSCQPPCLLPSLHPFLPPYLLASGSDPASPSLLLSLFLCFCPAAAGGGGGGRRRRRGRGGRGGGRGGGRRRAGMEEEAQEEEEGGPSSPPSRGRRRRRGGREGGRAVCDSTILSVEREVVGNVSRTYRGGDGGGVAAVWEEICLR